MKVCGRTVRCLICIGLIVGVYNNTLHAESSLKSPAIIISASPEDNTVGVDITIPISITFSGEIDPSTLTDTFHLYRVNNLEEVIVPGNIKYDAESKTVYFIPEGELSYSTNYRLAIEGRVKDPSENALGLGYSWRFTTRNSIGGCGGS